MLPDGVDFEARVAGVNQLLHILNSPEHDLPDAVKVSLTAAAAADQGDGADARDVFERIVDVAGRADLSALDGAPLGGSRSLAVELMDDRRHETRSHGRGARRS